MNCRGSVNKLTNNQFEMLMMHSGMMHDGLSSDAALAQILIMKLDMDDYWWLVDYLRIKQGGVSSTTGLQNQTGGGSSPSPAA